MRIHCDFCGAEILEEDALMVELDDGEVLYYCSDECLESAEYREPMTDPGEDEDQSSGPDAT